MSNRNNHRFYQQVHKELAARFGENFTIESCSTDFRYSMRARFIANNSISGIISHGRVRLADKKVKGGFATKTVWCLCIGNEELFNANLTQLFTQWLTKKTAELQHQLKIVQSSLKK
jgi:hypothetical protein